MKGVPEATLREKNRNKGGRETMKVYAIHCTEKGRLPKLSPEQAAGLKEGMAKALAANPGVKYNGTMFDPNTGIGVCHWEAPDAEAVEKILNNLGVPFDAVVAVQKLEL